MVKWRLMEYLNQSTANKRGQSCSHVNTTETNTKLRQKMPKIKLTLFVGFRHKLRVRIHQPFPRSLLDLK